MSPSSPCLNAAPSCLLSILRECGFWILNVILCYSISLFLEFLFCLLLYSACLRRKYIGHFQIKMRNSSDLSNSYTWYDLHNSGHILATSNCDLPHQLNYIPCKWILLLGFPIFLLHDDGIQHHWVPKEGARHNLCHSPSVQLWVNTAGLFANTHSYQSVVLQRYIN